MGQSNSNSNHKPKFVWRAMLSSRYLCFTLLAVININRQSTLTRYNTRACNTSIFAPSIRSASSRQVLVMAKNFSNKHSLVSTIVLRHSSSVMDSTAVRKTDDSIARDCFDNSPYLR